MKLSVLQSLSAVTVTAVGVLGLALILKLLGVVPAPDSTKQGMLCGLSAKVAVELGAEPLMEKVKVNGRPTALTIDMGA